MVAGVLVDVRGDAACYLFHTATAAVTTSAVVDLHIALASMAVIFRCRSVLAWLACALPIAWPIGIGLGILKDYSAELRSFRRGCMALLSCEDKG